MSATARVCGGRWQHAAVNRNSLDGGSIRSVHCFDWNSRGWNLERDSRQILSFLYTSWPHVIAPWTADEHGQAIFCKTQLLKRFLVIITLVAVGYPSCDSWRNFMERSLLNVSSTLGRSFEVNWRANFSVSFRNRFASISWVEQRKDEHYFSYFLMFNIYHILVFGHVH